MSRCGPFPGPASSSGGHTVSLDMRQSSLLGQSRRSSSRSSAFSLQPSALWRVKSLISSRGFEDADKVTSSCNKNLVENSLLSLFSPQTRRQTPCAAHRFTRSFLEPKNKQTSKKVISYEVALAGANMAFTGRNLPLKHDNSPASDATSSRPPLSQPCLSGRRDDGTRRAPTNFPSRRRQMSRRVEEAALVQVRRRESSPKLFHHIRIPAAARSSSTKTSLHMCSPKSS